MKDSIKKYYELEVSKIIPPPMPTFNKKKKIKPWDNILLTALAFASLVLIYTPNSYNSKIRKLEITKVAKKVLIDNVSRVAYEADSYFNTKRSQ